MASMFPRLEFARFLSMKIFSVRMPNEVILTSLGASCCCYFRFSWFSEKISCDF